MEKLISNEFLSILGFDKDGEHYSIQHKIEVYLPSESHREAYIAPDNKLQNYKTHVVRFKTKEDLLPLFRLMGIE
ncbi:hypothetical protein OQZ33_15860 [Pedobacter sp. MC2016-05]|uniref:hypothetical protein n=1 Tax=Pedobacter sp. MC2016-05 TaxID=2994474 RepID=UPI00224784A1|nr:hypothetical protein [Pedobacter sp. MC2016-05]MCX2475809.1 hypothetical protein [Pedobacter sp. MC2016-05]